MRACDALPARPVSLQRRETPSDVDISHEHPACGGLVKCCFPLLVFVSALTATARSVTAGEHPVLRCRYPPISASATHSTAKWRYTYIQKTVCLLIFLRLLFGPVERGMWRVVKNGIPKSTGLGHGLTTGTGEQGCARSCAERRVKSKIQPVTT